MTKYIKLTFITAILGFCFTLSACDLRSDNQNIDKENPVTIHDKIMSSEIDKEFYLQYKSIRKAVIDQDYKKAYSLSKRLKGDNIKSNINYVLDKLLEADKDISDDPENYEAYNNRAKYRYEFNDARGALNDINKSLEINPYNYTAYLNRAYIEENNKEYDKAAKDYDLAIKYNPYDTELYIDKGIILYKLKLYKEAVAAFSKMIDLEAIPYHIMRRSLSYYKLGDKEKSLQDAKEAEKLLKEMKYDYKVAVDLQNLSSSQDVKQIENELALSRDKSKKHNLTESNNSYTNEYIYNAKKYYEMLFDPSRKDETIIKYREAYKYAISEDYDKALKVFNDENCKKQEDKYNKEICSYFSQAIRSLSMFIKIKYDHPNDYWSLRFIGAKKLDIYDKKGAMEDFNESIKLNPHYSATYILRFQVKKDNEDYIGAVDDINLATKYDPYNPELHFYASQFFMDLYLKQKTLPNIDPIKEALRHIDEAIKIIPKTKYLFVRGLYHISLYAKVDKERIQMTKNDISLIRQRAEKYNNEEDKAVADILSERITKIENDLAYSLVNMAIYRQSYYSIDKIRATCNSKELDAYLKLADEFYSILNYKEIKENFSSEEINHMNEMTSEVFDNDMKGFGDNKVLLCAFIASTPYDVIVEDGLKLMALMEKYAYKTEYKDNYDTFKKTIISYIPKMAVNDEQKAKIAEYAKGFK